MKSKGGPCGCGIPSPYMPSGIPSPFMPNRGLVSRISLDPFHFLPPTKHHLNTQHSQRSRFKLYTAFNTKLPQSFPFSQMWKCMITAPESLQRMLQRNNDLCSVQSNHLKWPFHEAWMWVRFQLACGRGNGRVVLLVSVLYAPRNVYQDIKGGTHAWDSGTN